MHARGKSPLHGTSMPRATGLRGAGCCQRPGACCPEKPKAFASLGRRFFFKTPKGFGSPPSSPGGTPPAQASPACDCPGASLWVCGPLPVSSCPTAAAVEKPHPWAPVDHPRHTAWGVTGQAHSPRSPHLGGGWCPPKPQLFAGGGKLLVPGVRPRRGDGPQQGNTPPPPKKKPKAAGWAAGIPPYPRPKAAEPRACCHSAFCPADHCEKRGPGDRNT